MTTSRSAGRLTRRSASFIGSLSLAGRVVERFGALGQILLVAAFFGTTSHADLYFIASIVPLMIGGILGEALYATILPPLARRHAEGDIAELAGTGFWLSLGITALATAGYLAVVAVVIPIAEPAGSDSLAPWLAFAPIGLLLSVGGYAGAILLQLERYVLPPFRSAAATLIGLALTAVALTMTEQVVWVALAVTTGYAVSLALLVAEIVTVGGVRMLGFPTRAGVAELLGLRRKALASIVAGLVGGQLFVFVERFLAASLGVGAVAAISYSRGVAFTPIVLGQSIAHGLYPGMLRAHAARNTAYLRGSFVAGLRVSLLLALTCAVYVAFFAPELARLLFERGELVGASTLEIERSLRAFSLALIGTMLLVFTSRVFNALDFFRAIVWSQTAALAVYLPLAALLRPLLGPSGLALAFGIAELVGATIAVVIASRLVKLDGPGLWGGVLQPVLWRSGVIVAIVALAERALDLNAGSDGVVAGLGLLAAGATGAALLWWAPWGELHGARNFVRRMLRRPL